MAVISYTELVRRVPLWLYAGNSALIAEMPTIIEQAQDLLETTIHHNEFRTEITGETVGTDGLVDLSAETPRVLEIRAVRVKYRDRGDGWTPLQVKDLEALTMMFPLDRPARPRYYSERGGPLQLQLFPKPSAAMDLSITANVIPDRIEAGTETNIYTAKYPRAVEKACFHFAAIFMKDYEDAQAYKADMMQALAEAGAQIQRRERDETATRPRNTTNMAGQ